MQTAAEGRAKFCAGVEHGLHGARGRVAEHLRGLVRVHHVPGFPTWLNATFERSSYALGRENDPFGCASRAKDLARVNMNGFGGSD
eukprot:2891301-Rhodomonas_salina.1